jgi:multiple sugar transport system permease protein
MSRSASPLAMRLEGLFGERGAFLLLLAPAVLVLVLAQAYPLAYSAVISLFDWSLAKSPTPGAFIGFANYAKIASDHVFLGAIGFTVLLALCSTLIQLTLGLGIAFLTLGESRSLRIGRTLIMMPMVVAPIAVGTMWRMILSARVGPVNKALAMIGIDGPNWLGDPAWAVVSLILIDAWEWTPFVIIIFSAALTSLPGDVLRAAAVDGATPWQRFRLIMLPMLLPVILLVAMFRLIDGLLTLDVVFTTTGGGPGFTTHTLSFWVYQQGLRYFNISYAAATSWLLLFASLIVAAVFLVLRRHVSFWQSGGRAA